MLETLEKLLVRALTPAMGTTRIVSGPAGSGLDPRIQVLASRLSVPTVEEAERGTPRLGALLAVPALDPERKNWPIPGSKGFQVSEVSLSSGAPLRRGDQYETDEDPNGDQRIRLYRALPPGEEIQVLLEGEATGGLKTQLQATIDLALRAHAMDAAQADQVLGLAMAAVLPVLAELPTLEAAWTSFPRILPAGAGARLKMLAPTTRFCGIERNWDQNSTGAHAEAQFQISGQISLMVAIGRAEPISVIAKVQGGLRAGTHTQNFATGKAATVPMVAAMPAVPVPPSAPPPPKVRGIESTDLVRIKAIGDTTATRLRAIGIGTLSALRDLSDDRINAETTLSTVRSQVRSGKLQAVAVLADEPDARLPAALLERTVASLASLSAELLLAQAQTDGLPSTPDDLAAVQRLQRYLQVLSDSLDASWLVTTRLSVFVRR